MTSEQKQRRFAEAMAFKDNADKWHRLSPGLKQQIIARFMPLAAAIMPLVRTEYRHGWKGGISYIISKINDRPVIGKTFKDRIVARGICSPQQVAEYNARALAEFANSTPHDLAHWAEVINKREEAFQADCADYKPETIDTCKGACAGQCGTEHCDPW